MKAEGEHEPAPCAIVNTEISFRAFFEPQRYLQVERRLPLLDPEACSQGFQGPVSQYVVGSALEFGESHRNDDGAHFCLHHNLQEPGTAPACVSILWPAAV